MKNFTTIQVKLPKQRRVWEFNPITKVKVSKKNIHEKIIIFLLFEYKKTIIDYTCVAFFKKNIYCNKVNKRYRNIISK